MIEERITSLLAGIASGKRYWTRATENTAAPYIVLSRIGGARNYTMRGASGHVESRIQIDVYGRTYSEVKGIVQQILDALSGFYDEGTGAVIQGIFIDSERDLPATDAGDVSYLFRTSVDIIVHHGE